MDVNADSMRQYSSLSKRVDCVARLATVNRVACLEVADEAGLARIHSISNEGIELSSILQLSIGQRVRLSLSETVSATVTVTSKDGGRYSVRFEQPINCAELLRHLVDEARSSRTRPLRLSTHGIKARARSANGSHELEVEDISQRGMKVRHDGSFQPGLRLCVRLPNGLECRGLVRWTRDLSAGLSLMDILSASELGAVSLLSRDGKSAEVPTPNARQAAPEPS